MQEDTSSNAPVGASANDVVAPNGTPETASEVVESKDLHEVLNEVLGTTFKSPEDAVEGLKNTQSYVGRAGKYEKPIKALMDSKGLTEDQAVNYLMEQIITPTQPQAEPATPVSQPSADVVTRKEFEEVMFYKDNPDVAPFKTVISAVAKETGKPLSEVVQLDEVKSLIEAKKANDTAEQNKSVLHSNPRLGVVQDKITQAQEALKGTAPNFEAASAAATAAVLEAFEQK